MKPAGRSKEGDSLLPRRERKEQTSTALYASPKLLENAVAATVSTARASSATTSGLGSTPTKSFGWIRSDSFGFFKSDANDQASNVRGQKDDGQSNACADVVAAAVDAASEPLPQYMVGEATTAADPRSTDLFAIDDGEGTDSDSFEDTFALSQSLTLRLGVHVPAAAGVNSSPVELHQLQQQRSPAAVGGAFLNRNGIQRESIFDGSSVSSESSTRTSRFYGGDGDSLKAVSFEAKPAVSVRLNGSKNRGTNSSCSVSESRSGNANREDGGANSRELSSAHSVVGEAAADRPVSLLSGNKQSSTPAAVSSEEQQQFINAAAIGDVGSSGTRQRQSQQASQQQLPPPTKDTSRKSRCNSEREAVAACSDVADVKDSAAAAAPQTQQKSLSAAGAVSVIDCSGEREETAAASFYTHYPPASTGYQGHPIIGILVLVRHAMRGPEVRFCLTDWSSSEERMQFSSFLSTHFLNTSPCRGHQYPLPPYYEHRIWPQDLPQPQQFSRNSKTSKHGLHFSTEQRSSVNLKETRTGAKEEEEAREIDYLREWVGYFAFPGPSAECFSNCEKMGTTTHKNYSKDNNQWIPNVVADSKGGAVFTASSSAATTTTGTSTAALANFFRKNSREDSGAKQKHTGSSSTPVRTPLEESEEKQPHIFFLLPSRRPGSFLFGVSCYRRLKVNLCEEKKNEEMDWSVCVVSRAPFWGLLHFRLAPVACAFFQLLSSPSQEKNSRKNKSSHFRSSPILQHNSASSSNISKSPSLDSHRSNNTSSSRSSSHSTMSSHSRGNSSNSSANGHHSRKTIQLKSKNRLQRGAENVRSERAVCEAEEEENFFTAGVSVGLGETFSGAHTQKTARPAPLLLLLRVKQLVASESGATAEVVGKGNDLCVVAAERSTDKTSSFSNETENPFSFAGVANTDCAERGPEQQKTTEKSEAGKNVMVINNWEDFLLAEVEKTRRPFLLLHFRYPQTEQLFTTVWQLLRKTENLQQKKQSNLNMYSSTTTPRPCNGEQLAELAEASKRQLDAAVKTLRCSICCPAALQGFEAWWATTQEHLSKTPNSMSMMYKRADECMQNKHFNDFPVSTAANATDAATTPSVKSRKNREEATSSKEDVLHAGGQLLSDLLQQLRNTQFQSMRYNELFFNLEGSLPPFAILFPADQILMLMKALLLERKILLFSRCAARASSAALAFLSLFPGSLNCGYNSDGFGSNHYRWRLFGFPLRLFHLRCVFFPFLSLPLIEEVLLQKRGFLVSTADPAVLTHPMVRPDILVNLDELRVEIVSDSLRPLLALQQFELLLAARILLPPSTTTPTKTPFFFSSSSFSTPPPRPTTVHSSTSVSTANSSTSAFSKQKLTPTLRPCPAAETPPSQPNNKKKMTVLTAAAGSVSAASFDSHTAVSPLSSAAASMKSTTLNTTTTTTTTTTLLTNNKSDTNATAPYSGVTTNSPATHTTTTPIITTFDDAALSVVVGALTKNAAAAPLLLPGSDDDVAAAVSTPPTTTTTTPITTGAVTSTTATPCATTTTAAGAALYRRNTCKEKEADVLSSRSFFDFFVRNGKEFAAVTEKPEKPSTTTKNLSVLSSSSEITTTKSAAVAAAVTSCQKDPLIKSHLGSNSPPNVVGSGSIFGAGFLSGRAATTGSTTRSAPLMNGVDSNSGGSLVQHAFNSLISRPPGVKAAKAARLLFFQKNSNNNVFFNKTSEFSQRESVSYGGGGSSPVVDDDAATSTNQSRSGTQETMVLSEKNKKAAEATASTTARSSSTELEMLQQHITSTSTSLTTLKQEPTTLLGDGSSRRGIASAGSWILSKPAVFAQLSRAMKNLSTEASSLPVCGASASSTLHAPHHHQSAQALVVSAKIDAAHNGFATSSALSSSNSVRNDSNEKKCSILAADPNWEATVDFVRAAFTEYIELLCRCAALAAGPCRSKQKLLADLAKAEQKATTTATLTATAAAATAAAAASGQIKSGKYSTLSDFQISWVRAWSETHNFQAWLQQHRLPTEVQKEEMSSCCTEDKYKSDAWASHPPEEGYSRFLYENKDIYEGHFHRGLRHGYGVYISTRTGLRYEGEWAGDLRHGRGVLTLEKTGFLYVGEWLNDKKHGEGHLYSSTERYWGGFLNNKYHGKGTYVKRSGEAQYEGEFFEGLFQGVGKLSLSYKNKEKIIVCGEWERGKAKGVMTCVYADGRVYTGTLACEGQMLVPEGWGKMQQVDGSLFEGFWVKGKREGAGILTFYARSLFSTVKGQSRPQNIHSSLSSSSSRECDNQMDKMMSACTISGEFVENNRIARRRSSSKSAQKKKSKTPHSCNFRRKTLLATRPSSTAADSASVDEKSDTTAATNAGSSPTMVSTTTFGVVAPNAISPALFAPNPTTVTTRTTSSSPPPPDDSMPSSTTTPGPITTTVSTTNNAASDAASTSSSTTQTWHANSTTFTPTKTSALAPTSAKVGSATTSPADPSGSTITTTTDTPTIINTTTTDTPTIIDTTPTDTPTIIDTTTTDTHTVINTTTTDTSTIINTTTTDTPTTINTTTTATPTTIDTTTTIKNKNNTINTTRITTSPDKADVGHSVGGAGRSSKTPATTLSTEAAESTATLTEGVDSATTIILKNDKSINALKRSSSALMVEGLISLEGCWRSDGPVGGCCSEWIVTFPSGDKYIGALRIPQNKSTVHAFAGSRLNSSCSSTSHTNRSACPNNYFGTSSVVVEATGNYRSGTACRSGGKSTNSRSSSSSGSRSNVSNRNSRNSSWSSSRSSRHLSHSRSSTDSRSNSSCSGRSGIRCSDDDGPLGSRGGGADGASRRSRVKKHAGVSDLLEPKIEPEGRSRRKWKGRGRGRGRNREEASSLPAELLCQQSCLVSTAASVAAVGVEEITQKWILPEGPGLCKSKVDGETYEGQWAMGLRHGKGMNICSSGARYLGEWRCGCFTSFSKEEEKAANTCGNFPSSSLLLQSQQHPQKFAGATDLLEPSKAHVLKTAASIVESDITSQCFKDRARERNSSDKPAAATRSLTVRRDETQGMKVFEPFFIYPLHKCSFFWKSKLPKH